MQLVTWSIPCTNRKELSLTDDGICVEEFNEVLEKVKKKETSK
jgi:hypothetical protein